jgi:hypothetical protein
MTRAGVDREVIGSERDVRAPSVNEPELPTPKNTDKELEARWRATSGSDFGRHARSRSSRPPRNRAQEAGSSSGATPSVCHRRRQPRSPTAGSSGAPMIAIDHAVVFASSAALRTSLNVSRSASSPSRASCDRGRVRDLIPAAGTRQGRLHFSKYPRSAHSHANGHAR